MKRYEEINQMVQNGVAPNDVALIFGISVNTVYSCLFYARHTERRNLQDRKYRERKRRKNGGLSRHERTALTDKKNAPIIAAVDAGMTYAEVARKFGLPSRNAVAGIIHRRPEARGVGT